MPDDTSATFPFPAVGRKKITAAFDGGRLSSDGGVMLLAQADSLRDVIAFPKTTAQRALFEGAPSPVDPADLRALHLEVKSEG